jgi:hypothetical protein
MKRLTPLRVALAMGVCLMLIGGALWPQEHAAAAAASIKVARWAAPVGGQTTVTGSGFTPNDSVLVYADVKSGGHAMRTQVTTSSNGSGDINVNLPIPKSTDPGYYTVNGRDTHGVTAKTHVSVLPVLVVQPGGTTQTITVVARRAFFVSGAGFKAGEQVSLQASFPQYSGNTTLVNKNATAGTDGKFSGIILVVPNNAKATTATLTATGATSGSKAAGHLAVTYQPYIFLQAKSVQVGKNAVVSGRGFVANASVRVQIRIPTTGGQTQILSVDATADGKGNFDKAVHIPSTTAAGTYTVSAVGLTGGFKKYARLTIVRAPAPNPTATPTPTPTPTPKPSTHYNAVAQVIPGVTLPNQNVTVTGNHFPGNASVTISVTVNIRGGGTRYLHKTVPTDSTGNFAVAFRVPYKAAPGTYAVTAGVSGVQARDQLQVLPLSRHPSYLTFRQVSLWYHTVRQGTWDVIAIQANPTTTLGIWVHVIFPSGGHHDYYANTDSQGKWQVKFTIPRGSASRKSNRAFVTLQLWHGKQTTQSFMGFTLV